MAPPPVIPKKDRRREKLFGTSHVLAEMYVRWTLDCIPKIALKIAYDTISPRSRHYPKPLDVQEIVDHLLSTLGSDPDWPDDIQRRMRYSPYFGDSDGEIKLKKIHDGGDIGGNGFGEGELDGHSQFYLSRLSLLYSAARFMFKRFEESIENLRNEFKNQMLKFQAYLSSFPADTKWDMQGKNILDKSIEVLKSKQIAGALGVLTPKGKDWPLYGIIDGQGAFMIEEITKILNLTIENSTFFNFNTLLLASEKGRLTITGVMNFDSSFDDDTVDILIGEAYYWYQQLVDINVVNVPENLRIAPPL